MLGVSDEAAPPPAAAVCVRQVWRALHATVALNAPSLWPAAQRVYEAGRYLYGDKDTWLLGPLLLHDRRLWRSGGSDSATIDAAPRQE